MRCYNFAMIFFLIILGFYHQFTNLFQRFSNGRVSSYQTYIKHKLIIHVTNHLSYLLSYDCLSSYHTYCQSTNIFHCPLIPNLGKGKVNPYNPQDWNREGRQESVGQDPWFQNPNYQIQGQKNMAHIMHLRLDKK